MSTYFLIESGLRTLISMFIGGLIGWERESVHRPAGLRTHMLVAVGSCIIMQIGTYLSTTLALDTDPTRLGAQVISGMGFLGAGTILKEGATIRGLTTAASLWAVACLGLAVGSGAYTIAIIGFIAVILILTVFEYASTRIPSGKSTRFSICLQCHHTKTIIQHINQLADKYDALIQDLQFMMIN
ncbi:MAG: MgtC/SapB family protein, partial [Turicibacter sp.]|nr:MgtC/SapB family protein [Turicibacter sp.]